ncbi:MAG: hypothetical protein WC989_00270 [Micavibrio sp.]
MAAKGQGPSCRMEAGAMAACGEAGDQSLDDLLYAIGGGARYGRGLAVNGA